MIPWIIVFTPLLAAAVILFFGTRSRWFSAGVAILGALVCCALSVWVFISPETQILSVKWLEFGSLFQVPISMVIDPLSKMMLVLVTSIATLVFIYSTGYMAGEDGFARYFAGLSLFLFSMLGIVVSANFVMMFIFWELVGASSYILIGHYYRKDAAAAAAKQAFLVTRMGDFGFLIGILMLWVAVGSVSFSEIYTRLGTFQGHELYLTMAVVLVFCGVIGKSAQLPLHVWLPNSMEGPTPVSSLLHAATMVAAGVYMLARIFPIVEATPNALMVIAWVGGITCFVAGLMATQQDDIKRVLAYSTISQLGYMVLGVGVAPSADVPLFHLFTHAFFKCLLFLCAGSVIVALHHEQNIWKMGALKNKMPITFACTLIGGLALSGCPGLSGYFSKDLIIAWAQQKHPVLFWIAAFTVFLTAFYTFRMFFVTFLGAPRSEEARKASESRLVMIIPLMLLSIPALIAGYPFVESIFLHPPHPKNIPLIVPIVTTGFFVLGIGLAMLLYARGPARDPLCIPAFANRLYIDDVYAWLVRVVQGGFARACAFFDHWIIDGVVVQGCAKMAWVCGFVLRFLQSGNLQVYALYFAAGVIILLYLLLYR